MADQKISALTAATSVNDADLLALVQSATSKSVAASVFKSYITSAVRPKLTAGLTYYVRTDGNDGNTGLVNNAGGAFLTIQQAINTAVAWDLGVYSITIQVADGTYTGAVTLKAFVASGGNINIQGNVATPANCVLSVTSNQAITANNAFGIYYITGFKIQTTTSGYGVLCQGLSYINLGVINFGACASGHAYALNLGYIGFTANYTISGSAPYHIRCENGTIVCAALTITLSGTPAFSTAFAAAALAGAMYAYGNTFSGSGTGTRYAATLNGVLFVNGAASTYFPGSIAGSTATGGQYA